MKNSKKNILYSLIFTFLLCTKLLWAADEHITFNWGTYNANPDQSYFSLIFQNKTGWHTYWKNPGDAGSPIKIEFKTLNNTNLDFTALEWPTPQRYMEKGNLLAFGYSEQYAFFFQFPAQFKQFKDKKVEASIYIDWLICKEICIPGKKTLEGYFLNSQFFLKSGNSQPNFEQAQLKSFFESLPQKISLENATKELGFEYYLSSSGQGRLTFHYSLLDQIDEQLNDSILIPFSTTNLDFQHEEVYSDLKKIYGKFNIEWDGVYQEPQVPFPAIGNLNPPLSLKFLIKNKQQKKTFVLDLDITELTKEEHTQTANFYQNLQKLPIEKNNLLKASEQQKPNAETRPFAFYLLLAFLGGFILNLMPCVLPVISLKLLPLIEAKKHSQRKLLLSNLSYTLGVLFSFLILSLCVIALKSSGESIGWGFHLQSPSFVGIMILFIFLFSLNFFDLFDFSIPNIKFLNLNLKESSFYLQSFFEGLIATLLSTPCSAPFLGTALTFAFTGSNSAILMIFLSIGLGLSSPFILIGLFPGSILWLPRSGLWMIGLKKVMGLALLLTIVWLYDLLFALNLASSSITCLNLCLVFMFFAFSWKKYRPQFSFLYLLQILILIFLIYSFVQSSRSPIKEEKLIESSLSVSKVEWKVWNEQEVQKALAQNQNVFIDFTAQWCFTCKVNEKLVLKTEAFSKLAQTHNIQLFLADWTKRDPAITNFLSSQKVFGVPAYFASKQGKPLYFFGEIITLEKIDQFFGSN